MAFTESYYTVKNHIARFYQNVTETCYEVFDQLKGENVSVSDAELVDICNGSETVYNSRVASSEPELSTGFDGIKSTLSNKYISSAQADFLTKAMSTGLLQSSLNSAQQAALIQLPWETIKYDYCPQLPNSTAITECKTSMDNYQDLSSSLCCDQIIAFNGANAPAIGSGVLLAYAFGAGKVLKAAVDFFQKDTQDEPEIKVTEKLKIK